MQTRREADGGEQIKILRTDMYAAIFEIDIEIEIDKSNRNR